MYLIPDMIEMGLEAGEKFKSKIHRKVCITLGIGVPGIDRLDQLENIVTSVNKVPDNKIKTVTLEDLRNEYGLSYL